MKGCFNMKGYLILTDGTTFSGEMDESFPSYQEGEVVFYTGMTGYQEVLTDPSYEEQIVVFTYPLIGNYGINEEDFESKKPCVKGVVVLHATEHFSHYKAKWSLKAYLKKWNIPLLEWVDTRALVKAIREQGTQKAAISTNPYAKVKPDFQTNQVKKVVQNEVKTYGEGDYHVALIDFGFKKSIIQSLLKRGCKVTVVPFQQMEKVKSLKVRGVVLSNGPGDPKSLTTYLPQIKTMISTYPTLGICLGHQLIALSFGGNTKKLRFGHRGANHPVIDHQTGHVWMTSQNHSFVVDDQSLTDAPFHVRFTNVNDQSIEGLMHKYLPILSVQFHPEANPGPVESSQVFDEFLTYMKPKVSISI